VAVGEELGLMPTKLLTTHFKSNSSAMKDPPRWGRRTFTAQFLNGTEVKKEKTDAIQCTLQFRIPNEMKPPVLFYYKLTNFYQNHRRYAKSFNTAQLSGTAISASTADGSDCSPLTSDGGKPYYPCGLVANSLFNDTFGNPVLMNAAGTALPEAYNMNSKSGIAWNSDKDLYGTTKYKWADVAVPPNWREKYGDQYTDDWHPEIENDEALHVWMRLAGLPTFSKLAQRNDDTAMASGTYQLNITDRKLKETSNPSPDHLLTPLSLPCPLIRRHQIHRTHHTDCNGWP